MSVNIYKAANDTLSPIAGNSGGGGETYTAGDGINISQENEISTKMVMFPGTRAEWDELSLAEKVKYTHTCFDDDEQTGVVDSVPTIGSLHLITSGGVAAALDDKAGKNQISNPNLLDNPWFTVNQRGQSSYTDAVYCVDRWIKRESTNTLYVSSSGLTVSGVSGCFQRLDPDYSALLVGKTVTISILLGNGTIYSNSGTVAASGYNQILIQNDDIIFGFHKETNFFYLDLAILSANITVRAVKLELGSVSTLAMDTAPNYQQELAKCQRYYFQPINSGDGRTCYQFIALNTNSGSGFTFPVRMRARPSSVKINSIYAYGTMAPVTLTNVGCSVNEDGIKYFTDQSYGFTAGTVYVVDFTATADL